MSERPTLSWWRIGSGLIGAPIGAAAAMVLPSGVRFPFDLSGLVVALETWLVMSAYGVPLALMTGLPTLVLFEALGFRGLIHYALGGAAIGVLISVALSVYAGGYSPLTSLLMAVATSASAVVFWLYAIFDWPSYARRMLGAKP